MSLSRPARITVVVALLAAASAACGDTGGLRRAGATPTATSPARLWPELTPASSPAWSIDEADTETVKGVGVPGDDIRAVDPAAIVRAEIAAHPDDYSGAKAPYRDTAGLMDECADDGAGDASADGEGGEGARCPVLRPYYRDLTGDGRPDLTLGFRLLPGDAPDLTAVRVYTVERHRLVRVMAWEDAVSAVELAGRSVIIRSPSDLADYEYRLQWTWDPEEKAMLLTHDEMLRLHGRPHPSAPATGTTSPGTTPAPAPSPSASRG
ncbi:MULTISPECIES: hypothetical protein [unclassified Streptomyces]|uniref:hypothetical protein n=1 Tax=unclassified Streptomyces TaxID=2593676 RepID=UPI003D723135